MRVPADFSRLPGLYRARGFNQTAFAHRLEIRQSYLSDVVNNKKLVSLETFFGIAKALEMRPSCLLAELETNIAEGA